MSRESHSWKNHLIFPERAHSFLNALSSIYWYLISNWIHIINVAVIFNFQFLNPYSYFNTLSTATANKIFTLFLKYYIELNLTLFNFCIIILAVILHSRATSSFPHTNDTPNVHFFNSFMDLSALFLNRPWLAQSAS